VALKVGGPAAFVLLSQETAMAKKTHPSADSEHGVPIDSHLSDAVKDSAQQIWQAGLGAFAKAQAEGRKAFESLVREGSVLQRKTQAAAEDKISETTSRVAAMAGDIASQATGQWGKLETLFEDRVAKALNKLGVPSAKDIHALMARVDELSQAVQALSAGVAKKNAGTRPPRANSSAAKPAPVAKRVRKAT
jgi:poly(hydroxyalkanoate) granule-associated protein